MDGVKLVFSDESWILVRPSGTEPLIRIYIEASSAKSLNTIKKYVKEKILLNTQ